MIMIDLELQSLWFKFSKYFISDAIVIFKWRLKGPLQCAESCWNKSHIIHSLDSDANDVIFSYVIAYDVIDHSQANEKIKIEKEKI